MTRGKIIYIDREEKTFSSVEFNGDMYPGGNADRIGRITCILSIILIENG